jgi:hypothetical protein
VFDNIGMSIRRPPGENYNGLGGGNRHLNPHLEGDVAGFGKNVAGFWKNVAGFGRVYGGEGDRSLLILNKL